ncbi:MAG: DUF6265 family protein [Acidobacteriota bacterium]|nr:DUF6265 family protein [Acidobacteriota bacterium]
MKTAFFSFGFLMVLAYPLLVVGAIYLLLIAFERIRGCYGRPLNSPGGQSMRRTLFVLMIASLLSVTGVAADNHGPTVADLAWMTGTWSGAMGPGALEENWAEPKNGSMAALVRGFTGDGATNMIELISIEEENDSLVLRLKQWDAGMKPRYEGFLVMKLVESKDRMIKFENTGEGAAVLAKLGYSRPADDKFVISIETPTGQSFDITLDAVK